MTFTQTYTSSIMAIDLMTFTQTYSCASTISVINLLTFIQKSPIIVFNGWTFSDEWSLDRRLPTIQLFILYKDSTIECNVKSPFNDTLIILIKKSQGLTVLLAP